jgi:hypothetical protein
MVQNPSTCETFAKTASKEYLLAPELENFIGHNSEFYIGKWKESLTYSWNWPAFFGGVIWFAYRKMYLFTIMVALFTMLAYRIGSVWALLVNIGTAVYANCAYYFFSKSKIKKIKAYNRDPEEESKAIAKTGGTNWWAAGVVALFLVIQLFL